MFLHTYHIRILYVFKILNLFLLPIVPDNLFPFCFVLLLLESIELIASGEDSYDLEQMYHCSSLSFRLQFFSAL